MYILDTSAIVEILKNSQKGRQIIGIINDEAVVISSFQIYEILLGMKKEEIEKTYKMLFNLPIIDFGKEAAVESVKIQKELISHGKYIGIIDIFIASLCIFNKATLITLDKDFESIKGLNLELF